MGISKHELYLEACKYAVEEKKKNSDCFFMITPDGKRHIVLWSKVIEWLNDKLEDTKGEEDGE